MIQSQFTASEKIARFVCAFDAARVTPRPNLSRISDKDSP
jgi:hypothetical protein